MFCKYNVFFVNGLTFVSLYFLCDRIARVICTVCEYLRQNTSPYAVKPPLAAGGAEMAHFRLKQDVLTVRYLRNGRTKAACK